MTDLSTESFDEQTPDQQLNEPVDAPDAGADASAGGGATAPVPAVEKSDAKLPAPGPQLEKVAFVWDDRLWRAGFSARHPLRPKRLLRFYRLLESSGALNWRETHVVPPDQVDPAVLSEYHARHYIDTVRALSEGTAVLLQPAAYGFGPRRALFTPGMWEGHLAHVAAALTAARVVGEGVVPRAFTPAGGFHHAEPAEARANHIFNDVVLVIKSLLAAGLKVAFLDLDVTHGDGVQRAFYDTDRVLTVSLHEGPQYLFPGTGWPQEIGAGAGKGYTVNLPLPPATGDEHYLWAFGEIVPPLLDRFQPDVIVTQTGLGAHFADELAHLRLTTHGFTRLWRHIRSLAPRWVALGGGGLNLDVAARGWSLAYGVIADREGALPRRLPRRYAERWGPGELHDEPVEPLSKQLDEYVWNVIRSQVVATQSSLFPLHGLRPPAVVPGIEFEPVERPVPMIVQAARRAAPAPPRQPAPVRRPPLHQPSGPILPEPKDEEAAADERPNLEEPAESPASGEATGEGQRRRGRRRGRRGRRGGAGRPQAAAGQSSERRPRTPRPEGGGGQAGPPSASSDGEPAKKGRRRRSSRRGRSRKKTE